MIVMVEIIKNGVNIIHFYKFFIFLNNIKHMKALKGLLKGRIFYFIIVIVFAYYLYNMKKESIENVELAPAAVTTMPMTTTLRPTVVPTRRPTLLQTRRPTVAPMTTTRSMTTRGPMTTGPMTAGPMTTVRPIRPTLLQTRRPTVAPMTTTGPKRM